MSRENTVCLFYKLPQSLKTAALLDWYIRWDSRVSIHWVGGFFNMVSAASGGLWSGCVGCLWKRLRMAVRITPSTAVSDPLEAWDIVVFSQWWLSYMDRFGEGRKLTNTPGTDIDPKMLSYTWQREGRWRPRVRRWCWVRGPAPRWSSALWSTPAARR